MAKIRLYFDVKALQTALEALDSYVEGDLLDIVSFKVYESPSKSGTFTLIDTVDYNPQHDFIETESAVSDFNWFKLSYTDSVPEESEKSEAILAEHIYTIIDKVALQLGDINREEEVDMAFTDNEYIMKIKEACRVHTGSNHLEGLDEGEISMIALLVRISCCYDIAYDSAKYTKISLPDGISVDKGERVKHYLAVAKQLEQRYSKLKEDWQDDDGALVGTPYVEVIPMTRKLYFTSARRFPHRRYPT